MIAHRSPWGWLLMLVVACTIPNPRLCENGGACPPDASVAADLAQSLPDLRPIVDLRPPPDLASCSGDGACRALGNGLYCDLEAMLCRPCDQSHHCGSECGSCEGSAQPVCSSMSCACINDDNCGGNERCEQGLCLRACALSTQCGDAPAGKRCLSEGLFSARCGCKDIADCPAGTTRCQDSHCLCGVTICKKGQSCNAGRCQ